MDLSKLEKTQYVECDSCGSTQMHPVDVEVVHAGSKDAVVSVSNEGVSLRPRGADSSTRGVGIQIMFACEECPSLTIFNFLFHKGSTCLKVTEDYRDGWEDGEWPVDTIWRD